MATVQDLDYISALQQELADTITADSWCVSHGLKCYPENRGDIDFLIESAIDKLGIVAIVTTPELEYMGKNADGNVWSIPSLQIAVSEISVTNRSRANFATVLTTATRIAKILNGSALIALTIKQSEAGGIITAILTCRTLYQFVDGDDEEQSSESSESSLSSLSGD